jgi:hypothetical protein
VHACGRKFLSKIIPPEKSVRLASARFPLNHKSFFLETSMSANCSQDRLSLCSFTFVDGRRCRIPRSHGHPYLCTFHARRDLRWRESRRGNRPLSFRRARACWRPLFRTRTPSSPPSPKVKSNPKLSLPTPNWAYHSPPNPLFAKSFRINACKSDSLESVFTEKRGGHTH